MKFILRTYIIEVQYFKIIKKIVPFRASFIFHTSLSFIDTPSFVKYSITKLMALIKFIAEQFVPKSCTLEKTCCPTYIAYDRVIANVWQLLIKIKLYLRDFSLNNRMLPLCLSTIVERKVG